MPAARPSESVIRNALNAWRAVMGTPPGGLEIAPDGTVRILAVDERFARVMAGLRKIKPQYRMIGEVRLPGGDNGHCFFMADYEGGVSLLGIGEVAKAEVPWSREVQDRSQLVRFCDALEADYARRKGAE
jgi:hypothetical protein